jgi:hypothetical protein
MMPVLAAALFLVGCLGDGEPGGGSLSDPGADSPSGPGAASRAAASCLQAADPRRPADRRPAVVALLGDIDRYPSELRGPVNRLVRISLPDGAVQARRALGPRWKPGDIDRLDALGLRNDSGPLLAPAPDGRTVLALVRYPVAGRSSVAVVDARSLRVRCSHPLAPGVQYSGLLLGRSGTIYAVGARRSGRSRWDSVLTMVDADTGEQLGGRTLREADQTPRVRFGKGWWAYRAALSPDERRLIVSYHGGDTTGADAFRVSPGAGVFGEAPERGCRAAVPPSRCRSDRTDIGLAHGAVTATGAGFVAATGGHAMLRLDRRGRETGRLRLKGHLGHLMDFAIDAKRKLLYVSACGSRPGILRVELARGREKSIASGDFCGPPLAVHAGRFLVLNAARVDRAGYRGWRSEALRLLDLRRPGAGRPIPRSTGALDAVVVGDRR